ncbi:MAG: hypothetical protein IJ740_08210 [Ruminococcus sp.]|nr:hypothetical protein [Ruminococcus sp.]
MNEYTYTSGKLHRSHLKHFLDSSFGGTGTPAWYLIGKNIEDTSVELNPDVTVTKNILDESYVEDNGYEPSLDAETFYADPSDPLYPKIKDIAMNRLTGDACKTQILEVVIDKTTGPYDAWVEDVIVKPQSYGGPQGSVNIPYNVSFAGNRKVGTVTFAEHVPAFTETTEDTDES